MAWRACFAGPDSTPLIDYWAPWARSFPAPTLHIQRSLLYYHIYYGNTKDVLYIRK